MEKLIGIVAGYWMKPVADYVHKIKINIGAPGNKTKRLAVSALLCAAAAITQSAGALGGPGLAVSALATLPTALASIFAVRTGIMAYVVTLLLLLMIQPSEAVIFPFTTGLLGLGIGLGIRLFRRRASVVAFAAFSLTAGIAVLLYGFGFPVLGPLAASEFRPGAAASICTFSFAYSWLWVEISMICLRFMGKRLI